MFFDVSVYDAKSEFSLDQRDETTSSPTVPPPPKGTNRVENLPRKSAANFVDFLQGFFEGGWPNVGLAPPGLILDPSVCYKDQFQCRKILVIFTTH